MNKEWVRLLIGAFFEVLWVIGIKYSTSWWSMGLTAILIFSSFYMLIKVGETLPVGTAYAVFVGLGTAGTVIVGMVFFGESFNLIKSVLILTLLSGVLGLKLLAGEKGDGKE